MSAFLPGACHHFSRPGTLPRYTIQGTAVTSGDVTVGHRRCRHDCPVEGDPRNAAACRFLLLKSSVSTLILAPAQEDAWATYAAAIKDQANQMQAAHKTMFAAMGTATWQERRDI